MELSENLQRLRRMFEEELGRPLTSEEVRLLSFTGSLDDTADPDAEAMPPFRFPKTS